MKTLTLVLSAAIISVALLLSGCLGASIRPDVNFIPTGPTEDGVPAPKRVNIASAYSDCEFTIKVGAAPEVVLGTGEYFVVEVWPGKTPVKYKQRGTSWDPFASNCADSVNWRTTEISILNGSTWQESSTGPHVGDVYPPHPGMHSITGMRRIAAFSIQQTTPTQTYQNYPYYGPQPHATIVETGLVYLRDGVFTGKLRSDGLVHGQLRRNDGGLYTGDFKGLSYSGKGTLISPQGEVFTGTFSNGRANGEGICTKPGRAPEYCHRKNGAEVPPPSLDTVAREKLARAENDEREQQARRAKSDIGESESRIASLRSAEQNAPQRVRLEKQRKLKECSCFMRHDGSPAYMTCLGVSSGDESAAEREAGNRAMDRQRKACHAWLTSGGNKSDEELLRAELDRIGRDLNSEMTALARKKQQAEAQRLALIRKQDAERAQRQAQMRAEAETNRKKMLEERERECQKILTQPFNCGCNAYLPKSSPVPKLPGGTACPA